MILGGVVIGIGVVAAVTVHMVVIDVAVINIPTSPRARMMIARCSVGIQTRSSGFRCD